MSHSVYKCESCTVHMSELMPLINERLQSGLTVRFSPKGISMLPMLRQGKDTVTISPINRPLKKYDILLFRAIIRNILFPNSDIDCIAVCGITVVFSGAVLKRYSQESKE